MEPYRIFLIVTAVLATLAAIWLAAFLIYHKFHKKRPASMEHDYVWLGEGEHPYKHKKKINLKF